MWKSINILEEDSLFIKKTKALMGLKDNHDLIDYFKRRFSEEILPNNRLSESIKLQVRNRGKWRLEIIKNYCVEKQNLLNETKKGLEDLRKVSIIDKQIFELFEIIEQCDKRLMGRKYDSNKRNAEQPKGN